MSAMDDPKLSAPTAVSDDIYDNIRRRTTQIFKFDERKWRWSFLSKQFKDVELETLISKYTDKINHGYFSLFLIMQIIISMAHFSIILQANVKSGSTRTIVLDLILYAISAILGTVGLVLSETYVKNHLNFLKWESLAAFIILFAVDLFIPMYHFWVHDQQLRPFYTANVILGCYVFFSIGSNRIAISLACLTTVCDLLVQGFITYPDSDVYLQRFGSDFFYYICLNGVGLYYRLTNEIIKRRGFLDRRACVESTVDLSIEKQQEEALMASILPELLIDKVRTDVWKQVVDKKKPDKNYRESHHNVTILYADIVNYTNLTIKLKPITKMLQALNDLFGSFDEEAEKLNVVRIKFLGDCYYCVAGLPPHNNINHADACVKLGLKMIKIIKTLREDRDLDIDMRIGIHTGQIWSGIIGWSKIQFDIWSKDVVIANKMESTGVKGKLHITKQTKELLSQEYNIESTKVEDSDLIKNGIEAFFVSPTKSTVEENTDVQNNLTILFKPKLDIFPLKRSSLYQRRPGETRRPSGHPGLDPLYELDGSTERRYSTNPDRRISIQTPVLEKKKLSKSNPLNRRRSTDVEIQRRTAFMNSPINRYRTRKEETDKQIMEAFENLPLTKYAQWLTETSIHPFFLVFKKWNLEKGYIFLPDPLFRYYLILEVILLIGLILIQYSSLPRASWTTIVASSTLAALIIILLFSWIQSFWNTYRYKNSVVYMDEYDNEKEDFPKTAIYRCFVILSKMLSENIVLRFIIYLLLCITISICVLTQTVHCDFKTDTAPRKVFPSIEWTFPSYKSLVEHDECFIPWPMTETCALVIIMSFVFLRIHMWIKFLFGLTITTVYSYLIWNRSKDYYQNSESINSNLDPALAHIFVVASLTFTLHLIDRQSDYMFRLGYKWTVQLIEEQNNKQLMKAINFELLQNLLPRYVAELYMDNSKIDEFYFEEYSNVCVMFASITNIDLYEDEDGYNHTLKTLEEMISDFDKILVHKYKGKIEKIKMANWTYMAACGLDPGRRKSVNVDISEHDFTIIMLKFAVDILQALNKINGEFQQKYDLRIGISSGPATAGVIGTKKPLYDIWGDTVNMASRMDSTGVPGKIHVTERSATIIEHYGPYHCSFRDFTHVKNKGEMPTYFVSLDENFKLTKIEDEEDC